VKARAFVVAALVCGAAAGVVVLAAGRGDEPALAASPLVVPATGVEEPAVPVAVRPPANDATADAPPAPPAMADADADAPATSVAADPAACRVVLVVDDAAAPIAGATVVVMDGERDFEVARSDEQGRAFLPATASHVRGSAVGHWPATLAFCSDGEAVLRLPRAPRLVGRVFAPDGRARAAVDAVLLPAIAGRRAFPSALPPAAWVGRSDASGRFELPWPLDAPHDLVLRAPGTGGAVLPALTAAACGSELGVWLTAPARVHGTVAGVLPRGVGGIEVWSGAADAGRPRFGPPGPPPDGQWLARAALRGDAYAADDLPPGPAWIVWPDAGAAVACVLVAGSDLRVDLVAAAPALVGGTVGNGNGAEVFLYGGPSYTHVVRAAEHGAFAFPAVPPGDYLLGAVGASSSLHTAVQECLLHGRSDHARWLVVRAGERRVVDLPAPQPSVGAIAGQAHRAGVPAAACTVVVESVPFVGARRRRLDVDAQGAFGCAELPPGEYDVRLLLGATELARVACRVRAGTSTNVALVAP
jgi:hypothetical protein